MAHETKPCQQCGVDFTGHAQRRYCSSQCKARWVYLRKKARLDMARAAYVRRIDELERALSAVAPGHPLLSVLVY